uniref:Chemokine interleukin-8-like domain-containing protein n=4 Tax=Anas TaxID=8835 RepID=A0A493TVS7_ANAPP
MKSSTAALAVLVAALCCQVLSSPAAVNFSGPCCVKYSSKSFSSRHVTMYQNTSSHCPQPGVIFTTFKGKSFCGNPKDEWVQNILKQHKDQADSV